MNEKTLSSFRAKPMFRAAVVASASVLLLSPSLSQDRQGADVASGQLAFNNSCRTCHSVKEGDNRLGPNLYKVVGRKAGSLPNYGYSAAMKNADFVWDKGKLDQFIADPDAVVRGNNMKPYGGLASADTRAKVIAYLESVTTGQ
ncbi:MAG: c-type cytochrome [Xanthobacteraceae bacterium]